MAKGFADELMSELRTYSNEVGEEMMKEAKKLARKARLELKKVSPKDTGEYSRSWRLKSFEGRRFRYIVHNDVYQLTHLLENGFTHKPDMKFVKGDSKIKAVQDELNEKFERLSERIANKK